MTTYTNQQSHKNREVGPILFRYKRPPNQKAYDEIAIESAPRKIIKSQHKKEDKGVEALLKDMTLSSMSYFLKRVENPKQMSLASKSQKLANMAADERRKAKFEENRQATNRSQMKLIQINEYFVDFHGEKVAYENMADYTEDYYILQRGILNNEFHGTISMPEDLRQMLQCEQEDQKSEGRSSDSNREDNPDYDYPDQGSEKLVGEYYPESEEDQEELYMRYLRRCRHYDRHQSAEEDSY